MEISKEKQLLSIIKFTLPLLVIVISILITLFLYFENKRITKYEEKRIEQEFILKNKKQVKNEVQRVYDYISHIQKKTESELKKSLKERVYQIHTVSTSIYEKYKNQKSKEEIFQLIKAAISDVRYNEGRGYFFFDDINGKKVIYPIDKEIEGKNFYDYKDAKGYKFVQTISKTIKEKNERFDEYYWYKPNSGKKSFKKISFYKYFEPLNLAIGTGEYFDEFEKKIQKKVLDYINMISFGEHGYVFVINYDSVILSHFNKNHIGKTSSNSTNPNGVKIINKLISIAKEGQGYHTYLQREKPGTFLAAKKTSFVKGLDSWKWMIGSGFYEDDALKQISIRQKQIDEKFDSDIRKIFIISFLLTLTFVSISIYVSQLLEKKFQDYKDEIRHKQSLLFQQSKMAAMGEMIGNIAHQWRQPLSIISTAATGMVLQKKVDLLSDEAFYESTAKINKSAQYLSETINDFRNFFSPNKTQKEFSLKNCVNTIFSLLESQFKNKGIQLLVDIEDTKLNSFENELIQALINILNNARDELIKKEYEKYIFIKSQIEDEFISIYIKDNAGGISKDLIDRIFEPYFTTKHKSQGTGIGLYMTSEIVKKHLLGDISVENVKYEYHEMPYRGAQFKIRIPLVLK